MNTRHTLSTSPRAAAFVFSLMMTLAVFSGVLNLASPPQAGALLAQSQTAPADRG